MITKKIPLGKMVEMRDELYGLKPHINKSYPCLIGKVVEY